MYKYIASHRYKTVLFYTGWVYAYLLPFLHLKLGINFASILFCIGHVCVYLCVRKRCLCVPVEFPVNCFHNNMNVYVCIPTKTHQALVQCFRFAWKSGHEKQVALHWRSQWPDKFSSQVPVICGHPVHVHNPPGDFTKTILYIDFWNFLTSNFTTVCIMILKFNIVI